MGQTKGWFLIDPRTIPKEKKKKESTHSVRLFVVGESVHLLWYDGKTGEEGCQRTQKVPQCAKSIATRNTLYNLITQKPIQEQKDSEPTKSQEQHPNKTSDFEHARLDLLRLRRRGRNGGFELFEMGLEESDEFDARINHGGCQGPAMPKPKHIQETDEDLGRAKVSGAKDPRGNGTYIVDDERKT